jgi:hypothetical protein
MQDAVFFGNDIHFPMGVPPVLMQDMVALFGKMFYRQCFSLVAGEIVLRHISKVLNKVINSMRTNGIIKCLLKNYNCLFLPKEHIK